MNLVAGSLSVSPRAERIAALMDQIEHGPGFWRRSRRWSRLWIAYWREVDAMEREGLQRLRERAAREEL